jgi:aryl-alcohol dehydrogenase-like predicted oxidoreductase
MSLCQRENLGVIPYSPLAGGFLTGKYTRNGDVPADSRGYGNERMKRYMNDKGFAIIEALEEISQAHEATPGQIAVAWLLANPTITSPIVGANTFTQLAETLKAAEIELSAAEKSVGCLAKSYIVTLA